MTHNSPTTLTSVSAGSAGSGAQILGAAPSASTSEGRQWTLRLPPFLRGHRILLWVVGLVVVLVSLPLLQSLALKQNEMDALRALKLLGGSLQSDTLGPAVVHAGEGNSPARLSALVSAETDLGRRLPDTRLYAEGRLMFHHGYLFELVPLEGGRCGVRAWPLAHGETGLGAFLWDGSGQILGHPNQEGGWSGPDNAPAWPDLDAGQNQPWRPVQVAPTRLTAGS